jgi:hypothetical protein
MFHEGQKPRLSEALDFVEIPYQSTFNLNRKCIRMKLKYVYASYKAYEEGLWFCVGFELSALGMLRAFKTFYIIIEVLVP